MELLILSDSHGSMRNLREAVGRQLRRPEWILFLGDGLRDISDPALEISQILAVRGNCDLFWGDSAPADRLLPLGEHLAFLTHGDRYRVKYGLEELKLAAAERGADLVLYGHTHTPALEILPVGTLVGERRLERPMYLFNPGSIGGGSFGTLTLQGKSVLFSHGRI